jgi:predicted esterase
MKARLIACVSLVGFIAGNCAILARTTDSRSIGRTDALPQIPIPAGSFGIGRIGYDWVDPSRPDRYSSQANAHRELMVYFWYPTSVNSADARGLYLPGAQRMDALPEVQGQMREEFGNRWPAMVSGAIFSHATEHAPAANRPRQFPLIIFSHGLGSSGFNYTSLIEDLVSHGYVVASIEHTYTTLAVSFPDGRVVLHHVERPPAGLTRAETFKWMGPRISNQISEGAADIRFVLDRTTAKNGDTGEFFLARKIDLNRVVAMGHSAGAEFAARGCQLDVRLKACIDLDGGMPPIAALPEYPDHASLKQPLLFLEAYHPESQTAGTPAEHAAYFKKKEEQLKICRPGSYDVVLRSPGIAHPSFSDIPLLFAGQNGFPPKAMVLHNLDLIERYVREFLGKNLKDEKAPLLESGNRREASVQQYGR